MVPVPCYSSVRPSRCFIFVLESNLSFHFFDTLDAIAPEWLVPCALTSAGLELVVDVPEILSDGQLGMIKVGHGSEVLQLDVELRVRNCGFIQQEGLLELVVSPDECWEEKFNHSLVRIVGIQFVDGVPMVLLEANGAVGENSWADDWDERCTCPLCFEKLVGVADGKDWVSLVPVPTLAAMMEPVVEFVVDAVHHIGEREPVEEVARAIPVEQKAVCTEFEG